jgi:hypothetical protein
MTARAPLKPLDEALAQLLAAVVPLDAVERVATLDADGRVLAQDVVSALHVPPQDNSSMDGYALRCADVPQAGTVLPQSQRIAAGMAAQPLAAGTLARIFTGAPLPPGADAVLMQEDCTVLEASDGAVPQVRVNAIAPGPVMFPETGLTDDKKSDIIDRTLLKRPGSPDDIAKAVLFFAANAPYVTGQILAVDGGRSTNA